MSAIRNFFFPATNAPAARREISATAAAKVAATVRHSGLCTCNWH